MIDFHVHISAAMSVADALWAAGQAGYRGLGLLAPCLEDVVKVRHEARRLGLFGKVEAVVGLGLDHVPAALIPQLVCEAREAGAAYVLVHGEGQDEAEQGTNFAAVDAGADILARPGLVDATLAAYAAEKGVVLELGAAPGHTWGNGLLVSRALESGAQMILGGEVRTPADFPASEARKHICLGACLKRENLDDIELTYKKLWKIFSDREKM